MDIQASLGYLAHYGSHLSLQRGGILGNYFGLMARFPKRSADFLHTFSIILTPLVFKR